MTQPIDVAYVDIVVRDKSLKDLRRDVDETFKKMDKDIDEHLKGVDKEFDDTFKKIDAHFAKVSVTADESFTKVEESIKRSLTGTDRDIDRHSNRFRRILTSLGAHVGDVFDRIKIKTTRGLTSALASLTEGLKTTFTTLGQLGGFIGSAVSSSPLLILIGLLTPAIIALAAALSQLIGVVGILPAGLSVVVAAIVPVVVAFQNFGDAVSALASGDIEKIDEALKKLSPSAALVAREVAGLIPTLKAFQRAVQESFFTQLRGVIPRVVNTVLPAIAANFDRVAASMGTLAGKVLTFVSSLNSLNALNDLFDTTANIVDQLSDPLIHLLDAIAVSVSAGLPFVERLAAALGRALDQFAAFINKSIETGAFDKFIEDAFTTIKELVDLLKAAGGLIGTLFAGTEKSGHDLIKTLTDIITQLDNFFKSAEGKDVLRDLSNIVKFLGSSIAATVVAFELLDQTFRVSLAVLEKVGRGFFGLIKIIGDFFGQVPAKFHEFTDFLGRIPDAIGEFIRQAFDQLLFQVGLFIGLTLLAVQELPEKIISFITSLPQRIADIFSQIGPQSENIFKSMIDNVTQIIVDGFNSAVAFIMSVPDRIIALGPVFLNAGKNLIKSFMNGFRSVGSFIGDIAGDIVGSVKSFLNHAIDKINSGIAAIDAILPGNLARIPRLAAGGVVGKRRGGTLAVVGEGSEDEVVAPLSKLEDIIRKAFNGEGGGMTVNFGAGAINVSFAGAVPTEQEAFIVGRAVGDGIANQLAARNIRAQVRAA